MARMDAGWGGGGSAVSVFQNNPGKESPHLSRAAMRQRLRPCWQTRRTCVRARVSLEISWTKSRRYREVAAPAPLQMCFLEREGRHEDRLRGNPKLRQNRSRSSSCTCCFWVPAAGSGLFSRLSRLFLFCVSLRPTLDRPGHGEPVFPRPCRPADVLLERTTSLFWGGKGAERAAGSAAATLRNTPGGFAPLKVATQHTGPTLNQRFTARRGFPRHVTRGAG